MADADETKQQEKKEKPEKQEAKKTEAGDKKSLVGRFLPKIIVAVVVVIFAGAGLTLGRMFAGSSTPQTPGDSQQDQSAQAENLQAKGSVADAQNTWYYNLFSVINHELRFDPGPDVEEIPPETGDAHKNGDFYSLSFILPL